MKIVGKERIFVCDFVFFEQIGVVQRMKHDAHTIHMHTFSFSPARPDAQRCLPLASTCHAGIYFVTQAYLYFVSVLSVPVWHKGICYWPCIDNPTDPRI